MIFIIILDANMLKGLFYISAESRTPWFGAGIGLLLGMFIVLADQHLTKSPVMEVILFFLVHLPDYMMFSCGTEYLSFHMGVPQPLQPTFTCQMTSD